jgi:stage IV sporulation protein FB
MISIPGRIPIHIFPFFWFLILMIGWLNSASLLGTAIWSVVILVSVLIHEYGHALTALMFGQSAEINLVGLGGLTKRQGPKLEHWKEFIIVFNGPLAGFLTFIISYLLLSIVGERKSILIYTLEVAINVNFFWSLLNLLPVLPLDGGHLLRILLEGAFGVRGLKAAFFISIILASLIGLYSFLIQQILMGALFFLLAFESYRAWADVKSMTPEDTDQNLQDLLKEGVEELKAGRSEEALAKFSFVRQQAPKGMLYVTATQYAARISAEQGHLKQAYHWLYPLKNRLSIDYLHLLHQLAYRLQEWEEAVKIGEQTYQQEPSVETAMINALSYAIMGKAVPTVGWLRCAIQLGMPDAQKVIERREFDAIRNSDIFQKWIKSLGGT